MADTKVSDLTPITVANNNDELYIVDTTAGASKKITFGNLLSGIDTRVTDLNTTDSSFYRANVFQIATSTTGQFAVFKQYLQNCQNGTGNYSGTNGLSDMSGNVGFTYDVVANNDSSTTSGYYTNLIKTAMENLGYTF